MVHSDLCTMYMTNASERKKIQIKRLFGNTCVLSLKRAAMLHVPIKLENFKLISFERKEKKLQGFLCIWAIWLYNAGSIAKGISKDVLRERW